MDLSAYFTEIRFRHFKIDTSLADHELILCGNWFYLLAIINVFLLYYKSRFPLFQPATDASHRVTISITSQRTWIEMNENQRKRFYVSRGYG